MEEKRIMIDAESKKPIFISEEKHIEIQRLIDEYFGGDENTNPEYKRMCDYLKEVREAMKDADSIIRQCNDKLTEEYVSYHNLKGELANQKSEFAKELDEKDKQIIKIKRKISGAMINMLLDL